MLGKAFQRFDPLSLASSYCLQFQAESLYGRGFQAFRPPPSCSSSYWLQLQAETLVGRGYPAFRPLSLASSYWLQLQAGSLDRQDFLVF